MDKTTSSPGADEVKQTAIQTSDDYSFIRQEFNELAELRKEFDQAQMAFAKNLVNPDLSDNELLIFMKFANSLRLNPFTKEIVAVVYGKNSDNRRVNTIVTRDGKRVVATRTGQLDEISSEAIYINATGQKVQPWEKGTLWGATATVTRSGKKFTATVPLSEYNSNTGVWSSKPSTMIKKVAESQALSMAFPEILGSVYDEAEMPPAQTDTTGKAFADDTAPADEAQLKTLQSLGYEGVTDGLTKAQAAEIIKTLATTKKGAKT